MKMAIVFLAISILIITKPVTLEFIESSMYESQQALETSRFSSIFQVFYYHIFGEEEQQIIAVRLFAKIFAAKEKI